MSWTVLTWKLSTIEESVNSCLAKEKSRRFVIVCHHFLSKTVACETKVREFVSYATFIKFIIGEITIGMGGVMLRPEESM